jgi:hypothetical protein
MSKPLHLGSITSTFFQVTEICEPTQQGSESTLSSTCLSDQVEHHHQDLGRKAASQSRPQLHLSTATLAATYTMPPNSPTNQYAHLPSSSLAPLPLFSPTNQATQIPSSPPSTAPNPPQSQKPTATSKPIPESSDLPLAKSEL